MSDSEDPQEQEQKTPVGVWVFWSIITVSFLVWGLAVLLDDKQYDYVQAVVLTLTLIAVVWYTFLTLKTHRAIVQQTNVSILPAFDVTVDIKGWITVRTESGEDAYVPGVDSKLNLKNIGLGVALNVRIEPLKINYGADLNWLSPDGDEHTMEFVRVNSLAPKEIMSFRGAELHSDEKIGGRYKSVDVLSYLLPPKAYGDYEMKIHFTDIMGNKYSQAFHLGKSGSWPDVVVQGNQ